MDTPAPVTGTCLESGSWSPQDCSRPVGVLAATRLLFIGNLCFRKYAGGAGLANARTPTPQMPMSSARMGGQSACRERQLISQIRSQSPRASNAVTAMRITRRR